MRIASSALAALIGFGSSNLTPAAGSGFPSGSHRPPERGTANGEWRALPPAKQLYETARRAEGKLRGSPRAMRDRESWARVGRQFRAVVVSWPRSGYCDDALYYEGSVYRDAAERFGDRRFAVRANDAYGLLVRGYPASKWVPRALYEQVRLHAGRLADPTLARRILAKLRKKPSWAAEARLAAGILDPPAKRESAAPAAAPPPTAPPPAVQTKNVTSRREPPASPPAIVRNIRHWVGQSHTRVVIDLNKRAPHTEGQLRNPDRVFFDLHGASLAETLEDREFPIADSHLRRIRVSNREPQDVRVVLDFSSIREVTVFELPDPYRLVVDIHGAPPVAVAAAGNPETEAEPPDLSAERPAAAEGIRTAEGEAAAASAPVESGAAPRPEAPAELGAPTLPERSGTGYSLARQLGAGVRRIVIDAGHGGKDPGTRAGSLREKDIVLDIATMVRENLEERGFEVVMTRHRDVFLPLEQRAFIANDASADIFVSIHANAARNRRARGLETFYLNLATSPDAAEVAARENAATSEVRISDLPKLLEQIMNHNRVEESRELAGTMQEAIAERILGRVKHPLNRGVKTAGFHVLLGAQMPAILVEVGFVTNSEEAKLLRTSAHRRKLAASISEGVARYAKTLGQLPAATADRSGQ